MATEEQVQKLISIVETQMSALTDLKEENARLREEAAFAATAAPQTLKSRSKRPDRPLINAGIDDREWNWLGKHGRGTNLYAISGTLMSPQSAWSFALVVQQK